MPRGKRKTEPAAIPALCQVNSLAEAAELRRQLADRERELLTESVALAKRDIELARDIEHVATRMIEMAGARLLQLGDDGPAPKAKAKTTPSTKGDGRTPSPMQVAITRILREEGGPLTASEIAQRLIDTGSDLVEGDDGAKLGLRVGSCLYNMRPDVENRGRGVGWYFPEPGLTN